MTREEIGQRVKESRLQLGISQIELGKLCGYAVRSERMIQEIEHGRRPIPSEILRKLSDVLHIPVDVLLP